MNDPAFRHLEMGSRRSADCLAAASAALDVALGIRPSAFGLSECVARIAAALEAVASWAGPADLQTVLTTACRDEYWKLVQQVNVFVLQHLDDRRELLRAAGLLPAVERFLVTPGRRQSLAEHVLRAAASLKPGYTPITADGNSVAWLNWLRWACREVLQAVLAGADFEGEPAAIVLHPES